MFLSVQSLAAQAKEFSLRTTFSDTSGAYIDVPYSPSMNSYIGSGQLTVSMWFKPATNTNSHWAMLFRKSVGGCQDDFVWLFPVGNSDLSQISFQNARSCGGDQFATCASSGLVIGEWNHLEVDWDIAQGKVWMFINGNKVGEQFGFAPTTANNILTHMIMSLDASFRDIHYSKVVRHTTNFIPFLGELPDTNTIGLWRCNEGSGTTIHDVSPNHNNGSIVGTTYSWSQDVPPPRLVASYPFSGNGIDSSGEGNNATAYGGSTLISDRFGSPNSAYQFDGTGFAQVPSSPTLQLGVSYTVSAWFQISGRSPSDWAGIVSKAAASDNGYAGPRINLDESPIGSGQYYLDTVALQWNKWYHVALVNDGTTLSFYLNGILKTAATPVDPSWSFSNSNPLTIAGQNGSYRTFNGKIDDVRIYSGALGQAAVDSLYRERGYPYGNLAVLVQDAEGWGLAGLNARVRLYSDTGSFIDSAATNSNSVASFSAVPVGDGYSYFVDYVSADPGAPVSRRFWGQRTGISVLENKTTNDIFARNAPYSLVLHAYNSVTNEDASLQPVWLGTPLRLDLLVKNPGDPDAQPRPVKARVILDTNNVLPYVLDQTDGYQTIPVGTTATKSFSYTPQQAGRYYRAGALLVDTGGVDIYSDGFNDWNNPFFTVVTPQVTLLSPPNHAFPEPVSLTLRWSRVAGATSYQFQLGGDSSFATYFVNDSTITDTTRQVVGLPNGVVCFWRVRAISPAAKSAYTVPFWFATVFPTPGVPVLVSPADGAPSQPISLTIRWNAVANAIGYHVQASNNAQFGSLVLDDSTLTDTTRLISGLANNTTYYWRVQTINSGGKSAFSAPYSLTTIVAVPVSPTLLSPADASSAQPVALHFRWSRVQSANAYQLQVSSDAQFGALVVNDSTITDTSRAVPGLANHASYYWRVRSINAGGKSAYATPFSFSTVVSAPGAPVLLSPVDGAASQPLSIIVRWSRMTGAIGYQLQVSSDAFFGSFFVNDSTLIDTLRVIPGLANNTLYYWRVQAMNAGGSSGFASPFSFTTVVASPSQVQLVRPSNGVSVGQDSVLFVWSASEPEILSYEFSLIGDTTAVFVTIDTAFGLRIPASTGEKAYSWRVRAKNLSGFGAFSDIWTFVRTTTGINMPGGIPKSFALYQNYPNPFNPTTRIRYALPVGSFVTLALYNNIGQRVQIVARGYEEAGYHEVPLDGGNLASGIYFYRLQAGQFTESKSLILLK